MPMLKWGLPRLLKAQEVTDLQPHRHVAWWEDFVAAALEGSIGGFAAVMSHRDHV